MKFECVLSFTENFVAALQFWSFQLVFRLWDDFHRSQETGSRKKGMLFRILHRYIEETNKIVNVLDDTATSLTLCLQRSQI